MHEQIEKMISGEPIVVNIGLRAFAESLKDQGIEVVHIDWAPPAGGDQAMIDLLENLL